MRSSSDKARDGVLCNNRPASERGLRAWQPEKREETVDLDRQYDELYAIYGKPLEPEHNGEFLAISPKGEILLGSSLLEVAQQASARFGRGNFLYKVGEKAVGKLR